MIILHFDLQPQFKYMNYFTYTSHHCVVLLGKALYSHSASLHPWVPVNCWGNLTNCGEVTCDELASRPGEVEKAAACYRIPR